MNPADVGTRGIQPREMQNCAWLSNAEKTEFEPFVEHHPLVNPEEDKEIHCHKTDIKTETVAGLDNEFHIKFFKWNKLLAVVAKVCGFILKCRKSECVMMDDVYMLHKAETIIVSDIQQKFYSERIQNIKGAKPLSRNSAIYKWDTYLDNEGVLRVDGHLKNLNSDVPFKNPLILPGKLHVTTFIVLRM